MRLVVVWLSPSMGGREGTWITIRISFIVFWGSIEERFNSESVVQRLRIRTYWLHFRCPNGFPPYAANCLQSIASWVNKILMNFLHIKGLTFVKPMRYERSLMDTLFLSKKQWSIRKKELILVNLGAINYAKHSVRILMCFRGVTRHGVLG